MVELESRGEMSRTQVARFLREFADELEDDSIERGREHPTTEQQTGLTETGRGTPTDEPHESRTGDRRERTGEGHDHRRITFIIGGKSATVTLPNIVEFDVEVESRSPLLRSGLNQAVEFSLSWDIDEPAEEGDVEHIKME